MDETLTQLAAKARNERVVASQRLDDGMRLLAYPLQDGVLVAVGFDPDLAHQVQAETVLRKRSAQMARFGAWLPAQFNDGSWYLVRRVPIAHENNAAPILDTEALAAAQELLA